MKGLLIFLSVLTLCAVVVNGGWPTGEANEYFAFLAVSSLVYAIAFWISPDAAS